MPKPFLGRPQYYRFRGSGATWCLGIKKKKKKLLTGRPVTAPFDLRRSQTTPFFGLVQYPPPESCCIGDQTPPPPKKIHFLPRTRDFLRKRVCGFSIRQLQENILIVQTYLEGQSLCSSHLTPQIQCLPGDQSST